MVGPYTYNMNIVLLYILFIFLMSMIQSYYISIIGIVYGSNHKSLHDDVIYVDDIAYHVTLVRNSVL